MAAETALNATFFAKDWEVIIGIIDNSAENDIRKLKQSLQSYYAANSNPTGNTNITIATKEKTVVKIFKAFFGTTTKYVYNDTGGSSINRITAAIRLMNNVVDNYITTQLAAEDTDRNNVQTVIRKSGREILMTENFDNQ